MSIRSFTLDAHLCAAYSSFLLGAVTLRAVRPVRRLLIPPAISRLYGEGKTDGSRWRVLLGNEAVSSILKAF